MTTEPVLCPGDLAPGDRGAATHDLRVHRVRDARDPDFERAYARLWAAFGAIGEMETRAVIEERLTWDPAQPRSGAAFAYELLVLRRGDAVVAMRDHTAVVRLDAGSGALCAPVVVHLSHALVEPAHRGQGLVAWLRALPLQAARRCARSAGLPGDAPIVLVAEMEAPDPADPMRATRLRSYERAGFQKIDPGAAPYAQPDFRAASELARSTARPLPLQLVVRRVGREGEPALPSTEVAAIVEGLYAVYAAHVPRVAMDPLRAQAAAWIGRRDTFRLLPPTA